jgi:hypothetical protein
MSSENNRLEVGKQRPVPQMGEQKIDNLEGADVPGMDLFRHGYVVFASTTCADAYCVNTNVPTSCFGHEFHRSKID